MFMLGTGIQVAVGSMIEHWPIPSWLREYLLFVHIG